MNLKNGMKVFADCETAEYLTRGKEYEVVFVDEDGFSIIDDLGRDIGCKLNRSKHLYGGNWQIVKIEPKRNFFQVDARTKERKKAIQNHRKNNTNYTSDSAYILALIDADIEKFKNK